MDAKRILQIIESVKEWRGDVYKLAMLIAAEQRETDAQRAEDAGQLELADQIRNGVNAPG